MHVLTVVGARPQFIKAFPVSRALAEGHRETVVHTGQHYDRELSAVFFEELQMPEPAYHLGIGSAPPGEQIGRMMHALEPIVQEERPDILLVYGDTHSTLAGAIVGTHSDALLAHVEAGLRSHNRAMPEERNRILTDHASDLLFAPTERAVQSLAQEGITNGVCHTGDVMVDALQWARVVAAERSTIMDSIDVEPESYVVATVHRPSNTEDPARLRSILRALGEAETPVVFPAHPRTVDRLSEMNALAWARGHVDIIDPLGYLDFVTLLSNAGRVVTDSGGIQKEAFMLDTPCVTLRQETEWPETVESGWNVLVGASPTAIKRAIDEPFTVTHRARPFGDGTAAESIRRELETVVEAGGDLRPHDQAAKSAQSTAFDES